MLALGPFRRPLRFLGAQLPPLNFITIHYLYFLGTCLLFAVIFWGSSTPAHSVSFTDALFLSVSAMTEAGLNTVNLSELNTFQQVLLFLLILLGSAIWVSAFVVHVRKTAFEKEFRVVVDRARERRGRSGSRRMRSWSLSRRSTDAAPSGVPPEKQDTDSQPSDTPELLAQEDARPHSTLDGQARDQTPPARRGGPEMNGISSKTGDALSHFDSEPQPASPPTSPTRSTQTGIVFRGDTRFAPSSHASQHTRQRSSSIFTMQGVGARPTSSLQPMSPVRQETTPPLPPPSTKSGGDASKYFDSVGGWISRNSQFHGLSDKEREELGGCEYRAVSFLAWLVPIYFVMWQLLGCLGCAAWVAHHAAATARDNGLNPWWVGAFNAVSAFNNSGMSLLDANMTAFQRSYYLLITMSLLILAGNTCYPIFLRLIVWAMWKTISSSTPSSHSPYFTGPQWEERAQTLRFLLDHPRRCYTNLFPAQHTWWLLASVTALNGVDWAAFEILNINNAALYQALPERYRVIDGLFQAFAVRSGGFYVVSIPSLRISLQVLYVVMMYISVYPVVITMRNSNVYEERSLGIYAEDREEGEEAATVQEREDSTAKRTAGEGGSSPGFSLLRRAKTLRDQLAPGTAAHAEESNSRFVRQQLRAQLAHDAWWIALALFLIMIVESAHFARDPATYSVFNFLFEIVSAYGCVGISVGLPGVDYSFCGGWHTLSKLVLCAVMLRGRHRGLPVAIDQAVMLPGSGGGGAEEEDGRIRMGRTVSRGRGAGDGVMV
ncbi:hypothetical protein LTR36_006188 [Oleoguttula mirabilis]|uniref:Potassium transport protein n=1 Tax=Oleoguttula mirabilis TaxID=1507867 RepID=A0AAV9JCD6_9PEZI|nr:hypothetical protein LTR36_006188 [Oleoguttula mirabilis]